METFRGEVIEESLANPEILKRCKILSTRISQVTPAHQTPWLTKWTLHTIAISAEEAELTANELREALDTSRPSSWYIDFKSETIHYVIYPDKVFRIDRQNPEQYRVATEHGISLGIPKQQVDFEPQMKKAN